MSATARPAGPSIGVVGDIAVDYYVLLPPGRSADEKRTAISSFRLPGGTGANAAAAAAALGSQVTLHSAAGTDHLAGWLVRALAVRGVDTSAVRTLPGSTTQATILLDAAGRQVIVDRGVADRIGEADLHQATSADIVYVTGSSAAIRKIAAARTRGRVVAGIEAGMAIDDRLASALGHVDLVLTNAAGWTVFAGSLAGTVVTVETRGPEGAVIHDPGRPDERVPGIQVAAIDTTGAGDCLAGALCHYLASGRELAAACRLAVAAAGLSTRAIGAQAALPDDAQVRAAAAQHATPPACARQTG